MAERRRRVVVAGLGDTGLLTAIHLARHHDVVGVSVKPGLISGQEVGTRIARPDAWSRDYWIPFDRFRGLDDVRIVQGRLSGLDPTSRKVIVQRTDDSVVAEDYDALVISTGVRNGFWRRPDLQSAGEVDTGLRAVHDRLAGSASVAVIGGGAAAVSSAVNIAAVWPRKRVDLYFPGDRALPAHHSRVWEHVRRRLDDAGVGIHPCHRAVLPSSVDRITGDPVEWTTGQSPANAEAVVWAVGKVTPNTEWLPGGMLDDRGFVRVADDLRVVGDEGIFADIFAVGDVAATDPLRNSARNRADRLVAHNVTASLRGDRLRTYRARHRRWGSVLGVQHDGLEIFAPNGRPFRFPAWSIESVLQPWIVRRGIYHGIRKR